MITKAEILLEIRRTANLNGGVPLGKDRFFEETGIDQNSVLRYWVRWGDAVKEADLQPNQMNGKRAEAEMLARLAQFVQELGRFPIENELKLRARQDPGFPWSQTLRRRYGSKLHIAERLRRFCEESGDANVAAICAATCRSRVLPETETDEVTPVGYVYLVKHGARREYKIGRTNNPIRREGELRTELPEQLLPVHQIKTDDPVGIEQYWHSRFKDKRKNGEWFDLTAEDVKSFKRWRRIC